MRGLDRKIIDFILKNRLGMELLKGNFGLEKENVRVDKDGKMIKTPHPSAFGDKLKNMYIKTDFSESQVEMITPTFDTLDETYHFLENLQDIISLELEEEFLWPQSNPPILPEDEEIPIAEYNDGEEGQEAKKYRESIGGKYGRKKQLMSGIHYNFSLNNQLLDELYKACDKEMTYKEFKNNIYLKISRNFMKYRWLLVYLMGASPVTHKTYKEKCINRMTNFNEESYYFGDTVSIRNGICGYKNEKDYIISFDSVAEYVKDIEKLIHNGELDDAKELYNPVRLKAKDNKNTLESLLKEGVEYLEIRLIDLNPLVKNGIDLESLYLVHLVILFCLLKEDEEFSEKCQEIAFANHELVASFGRREGVQIYDDCHKKMTIYKLGQEIVEEIKKIVPVIGERETFLNLILDNAIEKLKDPQLTLAAHISEEIKEKSYTGFHMEKAQEYLVQSKKKEFNLIGYEDMELSTQILLKEAIKRGIKFEILDRKENFIVLDNGEKTEYIKQATKTSLDSYTTFLIMENKVVTKKVLHRAGIRVPTGRDYLEISIAKKDFSFFKGKKIVIKPKSTNFGIGITILTEGFTKETYEKAVEIAFKYDNSILIEEFISGHEYRFFVLGDEVAGILRRVPANVTGNGKLSIRKLVEQKNKNPLRGKGYRTPLEKIKLEEAEEMFLSEQGKDFDYIPAEGEIVYLRENSNISTGGDSVDYTDDIPESYKRIAVESAKAVGASICGVDVMIEDITQEINNDNYGIIELNFNPAIHIHCYPYKGENRRLGEKILDLLGL